MLEILTRITEGEGKEGEKGMKLLHICCNLAGSTVFPQLFEALKEEGLEQEVFVPEKNAGDIFMYLMQKLGEDQ